MVRAGYETIKPAMLSATRLPLKDTRCSTALQLGASRSDGQALAMAMVPSGIWCTALAYHVWRQFPPPGRRQEQADGCCARHISTSCSARV